MLRLTGPYGWDAHEAEHISLLCDVDNIPDQRAFEHVIDRFSAYRPAYQKIYNCIKHSGRYDCLVARTWFSAGSEALIEQLEEIGMTLKHIASIREFVYIEYP